VSPEYVQATSSGAVDTAAVDTAAVDTAADVDTDDVDTAAETLTAAAPDVVELTAAGTEVAVVELPEEQAARPNPTATATIPMTRCFRRPAILSNTASCSIREGLFATPTLPRLGRHSRRRKLTSQDEAR